MTSNGKTGRFFYKLISAVLLFSFLLSPFSLVFADTSTAPAASQTPDTSAISPATTTVPDDSSSDSTTPTDTSTTTTSTPALSQTPTPTSSITNPTVLLATATGQPQIAALNPATDQDAVNNQETNSTSVVPGTSSSAITSSPSSTSTSASAGHVTPMLSGVPAPTEQTDAPQPSLSSQKQILPTVNNNTGALQYSYPLTVPPGRNGMTPNLSLQYNSQNTSNDNIVGYGWNLSIPYIQIENKHGVDQLYTGTYKDFTTSDNGELAQISGSTYQLRSDNGSLSKYTFSGGTWSETTKTGLTYTYGTTTASQQNDSGTPANVYKWMLDKVTDANGNSIAYTYYKDQGQIYPATITYTNTSGGTGIFSVTFGRASVPTVMPASYQTGFAVTTAYRINTITMAVSGTTRHSYSLAYVAGDAGGRSLLSTITENGVDSQGNNSSLNPITFNYNLPGTSPFVSSTDTMPSHTLSDGSKTDSRLADSFDGGGPFPGYGSKTGTLIDVNGDGYPDWVETEQPGYAAYSTDNAKFYGVWLGSATGWTYSSAWSAALPKSSTGATYSLSQYGNNTIADVNGDGLPDIVITTSGSTVNSDTHVVWLNNGSGWTKSTTWTMPTVTVSGTTYGISLGGANSSLAPSGYSYYTNLIDVNNDGLPDLVVTTTDNIGTGSISDHYGVWLNTGTGWTKSATWTMPAHPTGTGTNTGSYVDQQDANRIVDLNGDGLPDWIETTYSATSTETYNVWLNTGTGWVRNTAWVLPVHTNTLPPYTVTSQGAPLGISQITCNVGIGGAYVCGERNNTLADVNGDGLLDFVETTDSNVSSNEYQDVWLNNGKTGWTRDTSWAMPYYSVVTGTAKPIRLGNDGLYGTELSDVNNDGLPDIVASCDCGTTATSANPQSSRVFLNTGAGWSAYGAAEPTRTDNGSYNGSVLGITDYTQYPYIPIDRTTELLDVNGDGSPDWIESNNSNFPSGSSPAPGFERQDVWTNPATQSDLLSTITYPQGGFTTVSYKPQVIIDKNATASTQTIEAVIQLSTDDGKHASVHAQTNYSYANGVYFYPTGSTQRKFAGFQKVTITYPDGSKEIDYYHQGNGIDATTYEHSDDEYQMGKLYRTDITDASGNLYKRATTEWTTFPITSVNSNVAFVYPNQTITESFDGLGTERSTAETWAYNTSTGNLTTDTNYGEVTATTPLAYTDIGSDKETTSYTYATNGTGMYLVDDQTSVDQSSNKVNETQHYYDSAALGTLTLGNETKTSRWKTGTTYISTQKAYNSYGLPTTSTDERGKVTGYTYDSYYLYPATVTDPLSHTMQYTYDYMFGLPLQTTDNNGFIYITYYDFKGRPALVEQPDLTTPSTMVTLIKYSYHDNGTDDYADRSNMPFVIAYYTPYGANPYYVWNYYDGLGRLIQSRRGIDNSGDYFVTTTSYNTNGQLATQSLPYAETTETYDATPATSSLNTAYTYDPLGRILTTTTGLGTTTNVYGNWKTTSTDPNSNVKKYYYDAYGNLVQVDEINGGSTYSTYYTWNLNKALTKITDASGNIRNFTYDGLGRRLTAQDLHASTDTTFGTWTYTYDDFGNLSQSVNPNGATVNYTYDNNERVATEDWTGGTGTEITYAYDTCTDGIGKLCSVTMTSGANTAYTYNSLGEIASENKTINSNAYLTSYTYNPDRNIATITYPDSSVVQYLYNTTDIVSEVDRKESGGSFTTVANSISYSPTMQIAVIHYANGTVTTNTFDPTKMYRLTNKVTLDGSGDHIQDFTYGYDADDNITSITNASGNDSSETVAYTYDALNRLKTAIASVSVSHNYYSQSFNYDALGNITSGPIGTYLYQGNTGTLTANPDAATSINGTTYTYDADGNLTGNGTLTNTWNYKDQLTQTVKGSTTVNYYYDQDGNRVWYKVGTANTYYPNKYYSYDGTTKTKQIYIGSELIGTVQVAGSTVTPWYVATDNILGTNLVTNSGGIQEQVLAYYPFGDVRMNEVFSTIDEKNKFSNHQYDVDTDLNYLGARYYAGKIGRFISEDPASNGSPESLLTDPQELNTYAYARNNPIGNIDPDGKLSLSSAGGFTSGLLMAIPLAAAVTINAVFHPVQTYQSAKSSIEADGSYIADLTNNPQNTLSETVSGLKQDYSAYNKQSDFMASAQVGLVVGSLATDSEEDTVACRGGSCTAETFLKGSNEYKAGLNPSLDDPLTGISVNKGASTELGEVTTSGPLAKYSQYGQTTQQSINALGGELVDTPSNSNPYHANINGLNAKQLENLFTPTKKI